MRCVFNRQNKFIVIIAINTCVCVLTLINTLMRTESEGEGADESPCSDFFLHIRRRGVRGPSCPSIASSLPPRPYSSLYLSIQSIRKGQSQTLALLEEGSRASNKWLCAASARETERGREGDAVGVAGI